MSGPSCDDPSKSSLSAWPRVLARVFDLTAAVSLLLAVSAAVLWYRSYTGMDCVSVNRGRYELELTAPTDGLTFFFQDDGHPGSPAYRPEGAQTFSDRIRFAFQRLEYPPVGFRRDVVEYLVSMHYHPFFEGDAPQGKFSRFTVDSLLPDNVHTASFGWGIVIPTWFVVLVLSLFPALWAVRRFTR